MKTKVLAVLALICVVTLSATPQTKSAQWEYKLEFKMNEKRANQLGAEGWELAAIESTSTAGMGNNVPVYVFKRPRQ